MSTEAPRHSLILVVLHAFLALGALGGGLMMIISPGGSALGLAPELLEGSPFDSYLIPGIVLFTALGVLPCFVVYGLIARPAWEVAEVFNIYRDQHWAWTFSLYVGFILVLWIVGQVAMIKELFVLQLVFILLGVVIQAVTFLPATQRKYPAQSSSRPRST